ncbi:hypothetical protein SO802_034305 [Lithocarpus litseifolius]|uniref:Uncharacterized protein n=1 Tax=Lithocarpus litseifolius TaxID=425828 RepID=A0AAW2BL77_9ROSI
MHRSSSTSRVSSELFSSQSQSQTSSSSSSDNDQQQEQKLLLPTYDPLFHVAKKQLSRLRSAQSAVHLIPLVLLLCAIILWFFSTPASTKIVLHLGATDWLESPEVSSFPQLGPLGCATIELLLNDGNKESFLHG